MCVGECHRGKVGIMAKLVITRWQLEQELGFANDETEVWVEHNGDLFKIDQVVFKEVHFPHDHMIAVIVADEK